MTVTAIDELTPVVQLPRRRIRRTAICPGCGTPLRGTKPYGRCATCREGLPTRQTHKDRRPRAGTWADLALAEQLADAA
jgi:tRNA(Ile2) C34 agmatinyltransferase TiaS